ncbi:hypothetical protein [Streptomyces sp. NPDC001250]|uniref:hypothetical protein n=1 Tax=unclassified Streptomyces TaxID=2593676 RepID=UPI00331D6CFA
MIYRDLAADPVPHITAGETPSAQGTPVAVVASRGGSYAPGATRECYEFAPLRRCQ